MALIEPMIGDCGISRVLAELNASPVVPLGWRRVMYSAIDHLRASSASDEKIEIAERMSVSLLKLDWAVQKGDRERQDHARQQLSELGDRWHDMSSFQSADDVLELQEVETINEALERLNRRSL